MQKIESITLGGGCFWCIEGVFSKTKGIISAISGYSGGQTENPKYAEVCGGNTGHGEVVKVDFDSDIISLEVILNIFWTIHDPTTLNQQGADIGTQYRSIIFYNNKAQKEAILKSIKDLENQEIYQNKVVTEVLPEEKFYEAEQYHQKYFEKNPFVGYCRAVVAPKVQKFRQYFINYFVE
jgi:methionine-S-sulfoxide reductase